MTALFRPFRTLAQITLFLAAAIAAMVASAQSDMPIYTDGLQSGWQDWSWGERSFDNAAPVHAGSQSIRSDAQSWEAISFAHGSFDSSAYLAIEFWAHGGTSGGQRLQMKAHLSNQQQPQSVNLPPLPANEWRKFIVPLESLGVANQPDFSRFWLQLRSNGSPSPFYLDDVVLIAKPPPALVDVSIVATQSVNTVDARLFGVNATMWDGDWKKPVTDQLLEEMGARVLRCPGGSLSDQYHWQSNTTLTNTWKWRAGFEDFARTATNIGAQMYVTVNYGSGTPEEAAAWVRYSNVIKKYGFKYWEIGNECYGPWEYDINDRPHDPFTYATRAREYMLQMRAADPTIKIGVVAVTGEDSYSNGYTDHTVRNPRTGQWHDGWTPVMLATLRDGGVLPDFLIFHKYPQYNTGDDAFLLQSSSAWLGDAADLRRQLTDYVGAGAAAIELAVTENNCASGFGENGTKQAVNLVNGLYQADNLGWMMRSGFKVRHWWSFRDAHREIGKHVPVYGWREYANLGMVNDDGALHPAFYTFKLLQHFARGGESVLPVTADYQLLSVHAVRRPTGALNLLVINRSGETALDARIAIDGFQFEPEATAWSYGIPQDEAARTGVGSPDIARTNLIVSAGPLELRFPPYSATVLALAPAAPKLTATFPAANTLQLTVHGQPGARYALEATEDFTSWQSVATNTLQGATWTLDDTVTVRPDQKFYRAVWLP